MRAAVGLAAAMLLVATAFASATERGTPGGFNGPGSKGARSSQMGSSHAEHSGGTFHSSRERRDSDRGGTFSQHRTEGHFRGRGAAFGGFGFGFGLGVAPYAYGYNFGDSCWRSVRTYDGQIVRRYVCDDDDYYDDDY